MLEDLLIDELFSDENQYTLDHRGHTVVVVVENSGPISTTVRLFVDGQLIDTKRALSTTVRISGEPLGPDRPPRIEGEVCLGLLGDVKSCTLIDGHDQYAMPRLGTRS